tara:strand:+ start:295 stop:450 length:156 start_codon:yes stop_codon:yes gene_type:complete
MNSRQLYEKINKGGTILLKPEDAIDIAQKLAWLEKQNEVELYDWHDEAIRK